MSAKTTDVCLRCGKALTGRQTQFCSRTCKVAHHGTYPNEKKRRFTRKQNFVEMSGKQCQHCGYDRNQSALVFHHREQKEFLISSTMLGRLPISESLKELEKCDLLCHNCHFEHHYPWMAFERIHDYLSQPAPTLPRATKDSSSGYCITCGKDLEEGYMRFCSMRCRNGYYQSYEMQQRRGVERKLEFVNKLGGKCKHCGYRKNLAGLAFHHTRGKSYRLDLRSIANRSMKSLLAELEKCELLCHNCHAELHNPQLNKNAV
ncbi:MAG: hypothetical protein SF029_14210 [bacterium]|nr:hypothetical protein [bacterium]